MNTDIYPAQATPESLGIASQGILAFLDALEKNAPGVHSFILLRHGAAAAQGWWRPYRAELPHMLFSLSKSFTSSAVGLAVGEGRLTVEDRVLSFFPEDAPAEVSKNLAAMRVRDLLTMTTGNAEDTFPHIFRKEDVNWVRAILERPVEYAPGTHFVYNSGATYLLSALVQKVTGQTLMEYLTPHLIEPLGIRGAAWETSPQGINTGGWGLAIKTVDIARFGQMLLQRGRWEGRQVLPERWVAEATARQVPNDSSSSPDWVQGYGYQFWRCRHNAFRGDGAFGQFCVVMPDQDAVLAVTAGIAEMQPVLDAAWDWLLPAMGAGSMRDNSAASARLAERLAGLAYEPPQASSMESIQAAISGKTWQIEPNPLGITSITLEFAGEAGAVTMRSPTGEERLAFGLGHWLEGNARLFNPQARLTVCSGAWDAPDCFTLTARVLETPVVVTVPFRFEGDALTVAGKMNLSFGPTEFPVLKGGLP